MSLYIKDMTIFEFIDRHNAVGMVLDVPHLFYTFYGHPIIDMPPHGRLIDAEQAIKEIEDAIENIDRYFSLLDFNSRYCMERGLRMAKIFIKTAPTIIGAEEEKK